MAGYSEIDQENKITTQLDNNYKFDVVNYISSFIDSVGDSLTSTEDVSGSYKIDWVIVLSLTFFLIFVPLIYFFYRSISKCCMKNMNCSNQYNIIDEPEAVVVGKNGEIITNKI